MAKPSQADVNAAIKGNQEAADKAREQGREKDANAAQAAADHWRQQR